MSDERTRIVGAGYDAMADTWAEWSAQITDEPRGIWLNKLLDLLPGGDVLELGCGDGTRETGVLASRYRTTGVDLSVEQLRRARERVPDATFVHADVTEVSFAAQSFDAVCAFYVLSHVPRELLPALFARVRAWLRPGGYFLATLGASDVENWHGEWLGVPMYFSGHVPDRNRELLADFALFDDEVVTIAEPEGEVSFHWILART
ncbi:MAG TPA: class I SAM-dependent methyltransferase [Gaiellaceae bacterium]|nr:class I SAM-dependent methyltransferase [Gaiellaceae bacterium]